MSWSRDITLGLVLGTFFFFTRVMFPTNDSATVMLIFAALLIVSAMAMKFQRVILNERGKGHCYDCGYNLTGLTSERCPECGRTLEIEERSNDEVKH